MSKKHLIFVKSGRNIAVEYSRRYKPMINAFASDNFPHNRNKLNTVTFFNLSLNIILACRILL